MINYNEINDFIFKVFNYYNGKINPINKAVLDINWCNLMMNNTGGYSRLPNKVIINPMVITRFYNNNEFFIKVSIIETIIHELYHTDQLINYNLYMTDINYNKFIEHACEIQTAIYISGHTQEIYNVFGLDVRIHNKEEYNREIAIWDLPGVRYQRRYYHDHIFMCVDVLCNLEQEIAYKIHQFITNNIENRDDIIININDEQVNVCLNGQLMHIDEFNKIFLKYACTGLHKFKRYIVYNKDTKKLSIDIQTEVLDIMCKKV